MLLLPPRPILPIFLIAFGRLRRYASISSSNLRFLFWFLCSRRRSSASLAFLLFLRAIAFFAAIRHAAFHFSMPRSVMV
jgi:hypothetical protein